MLAGNCQFKGQSKSSVENDLNPSAVSQLIGLKVGCSLETIWQHLVTEEQSPRKVVGLLRLDLWIRNPKVCPGISMPQ